MSIRLLILLIIVFVVGGLSACKKNNDAPTVNQTVGLNVINASADTVNFYLNGTRLNGTSNLLPGYSTGYYPVPVGSQTFQIKKPFNTVTNTMQTLFNITLTSDNNPYHSLFITGPALVDTFTTVDKLDTTSKSDTCFIRFVNASPGTTALDMAYGGTTQFTNRPSKSVTAFTFVNTVTGASINGFIALKVFKAGTTVALATDSVTLVRGSSYTFYSVGVPGSATFSIATMINSNGN
jgi:hypothetical protein